MAAAIWAAVQDDIPLHGSSRLIQHRFGWKPQVECGRMTGVLLKHPESLFMLKNIPLFFKRFGLTYYREGTCIEYFVRHLLSAETISSALVLSYNARNKDLHVSRFYPELRTLPDSKYLSAACFYLLIQHSAAVFALDETCHISLETVPQVSDCFYRKLGDFKFVVCKHGIGNVVELISDIVLSAVDTRMIGVHVYKPGEIPFMKG
jgi:hypothetical protein